MIRKLLLHIFPPKCIFCGNIFSSDSDISICNGCLNSIEFLDIESDAYQSVFKSVWCDKIICSCRYEGMIRRALIKYKFSNKPTFYRALAYIIFLQLRRLLKTEKIDTLLAVPLSSKRQRMRGYNQAYLLSYYLSKILGINNCSAIINRVKDTTAQSSLMRKERRDNIKNAFVLEDIDFVRGKNILILDDVFTTGSTLDECARVLKEAGANKVFGTVVASSRRF